ncbi:MAG: hypothetical protein O9331_09960 [Acidovorax sp.]|nr:hypothetical protein [Acidovorax sp.]
METSTLIGLALAFAACLVTYLASPNQRWREVPVPPLPARAGGLGMCVAAWLCLAHSRQPLTATLMLYTALMVSCVALACSGALPGLLKKKR